MNHFFRLLIIASAVIWTACDDGSTAGAGPSDAGSDAAAAADVAPDVPVLPEVPVGTTPHPEGPYGIAPGDVIADLELYWKAGERTIRLSDYYQQPSERMMIIVSTAAWCQVCRVDALKLIPMWEQWASSGLEVLFAISRDKYDLPMYGDPDAKPIHDLIMDGYLQELGMPYPLVADTGFQLEPFYTSATLPLVVAIDTQTMTILYVSGGFDDDYLNALLQERLGR